MKTPKSKDKGKIMNLALIALGLSPTIIEHFFEHFCKADSFNKGIADSVNGGIKDWRTTRQLKKEVLTTVTMTIQSMIRVSLLRDEFIEDEDLPCCTSLSTKIITSAKFKTQRRNVKEAISAMFTIDGNFEKAVSLWRKFLELLRMELFLLGKNTCSMEIKHADLFLGILEGKKLKHMSKKRNWKLEFVNEEFDRKLLERFIFAVDGIKSNFYVVDKPMTAAKAMGFIGIGRTAFHKLINNGQIKPHYFNGLSTPFFFPAEIVDTLKRGKKMNIICTFQCTRLW